MPQFIMPNDLESNPEWDWSKHEYKWFLVCLPSLQKRHVSVAKYAIVLEVLNEFYSDSKNNLNIFYFLIFLL